MDTRNISEEEFKEYSAKNIHFYDSHVSDMVTHAVCRRSGKGFRILDLGCGDGRLLCTLKLKGYLDNADITGVDLSPERIKNLTENLRDATGIVSDACDVWRLEDNSFDMIISSQVIEHIPDDSKHLKEIRRLLKDDGLLYISSVIKKWYGLYIYRNDGTIRLDPTHLREYASKEEFEKILKSNCLKPQKSRVFQCSFPVVDMFVRLMIKGNMIKPNVSFFNRHNLLSKSRALKVPIPGYSIIETLAQK